VNYSHQVAEHSIQRSTKLYFVLGIKTNFQSNVKNLLQYLYSKWACNLGQLYTWFHKVFFGMVNTIHDKLLAVMFHM